MQNTVSEQFKRNFFYSANSEHYQDAVLTYIFYNYPEEGKDDKELSEIEKFSKYFTGLLIDGDKNNIIITKIDVETQIHDSDIDLIIHTKDGKDHLVIIEDKTGSTIHGSVKKQRNSNDENSQTEYYDTQLEKYYDQFIHDENYQEYFKEGRIHLYYYKNEYVNSHEEVILEKAREGCKKIFCNPFLDDIANKNKELYKLMNDGKNHYDSTFEKKRASIEEWNTKTKEYQELLQQYGDSIAEWKKLDIKWICKAFNDFFKNNRPDNLILKEYFDSIKFWNSQIENVIKNEYEINSDDTLLWGDTSKLWNPVFCQMLEVALEKTKYNLEQDTKVETYNGRYWQMSLHSKDKKTCMIITTKGINDRSISIGINLRNPKYDGNDNVPEIWITDEKARDKDLKKLIDTIKNVKIDDVAPELSNRKKTDGQDNNKICSYDFNLKPGEKVDYNTILAYWMKVQNVFMTKLDGCK